MLRTYFACIIANLVREFLDHEAVQVKTGLGEAMEGLDDGILPEHGQGEDDGGR